MPINEASSRSSPNPAVRKTPRCARVSSSGPKNSFSKGGSSAPSLDAIRPERPNPTMHRFYISPNEWNPDLLVLPDSEAHHAREVLRLERGDKVVVFNGEGHEVT